MSQVHVKSNAADVQATCKRFYRRYGYALHSGPYIGAAYHAATDGHAVIHTDTRIINHPPTFLAQYGWNIYAD